MFDWPLVVNDRAAAMACYEKSMAWLTEQKEARESLTKHIWAYHEAADLVPQTLGKLMSGHYFPYSESYNELESAYLLSLLGFYRHALVGLRSVLELGIIGVFFAVEDHEEIEVKPWLRGVVRTPQFGAAVARLERLSNYPDFNRQFALRLRLLELYDQLGAYAHIRGYKRSNTGLGISNINTFTATALQLFIQLTNDVVRMVLTVMLLKYPLGLRPMPLDQKYGLNGPVGSFVQAHQVELFRDVLDSSERDLLQTFSDRDPDVRAAAAFFEGLPEITEEEFKAQVTEFNEAWKPRSAD